jgi:hypothetical protein
MKGLHYRLQVAGRDHDGSRSAEEAPNPPPSVLGKGREIAAPKGQQERLAQKSEHTPHELRVDEALPTVNIEMGDKIPSSMPEYGTHRDSESGGLGLPPRNQEDPVAPEPKALCKLSAGGAEAGGRRWKVSEE